ncbi:MAG: radical SAM protein [Polaromonas sp.]
MPIYVLSCIDQEGQAVELSYSPHDSTLIDETGKSLLTDIDAADFTVATPVSPSMPGWKSDAPLTLKIQLGLNCNYSCSYCNQASEVGSGTVTKTADADEFLQELGSWLKAAPERIEFWGGEPFLYMAKLKRLVPDLRARFPLAKFSIVTNGSLLDEDILAFIEKFDIFIAVSHDGPGQHLRGPDPFDDPERATWLQALWKRRGGDRGRVSFNAVLTPANADIRATRQWLANQLGDAMLTLDTEGVVSVYDDQALAGPGHWSKDDYALLHQSIVEGFLDGQALQFGDIAYKARDFIHSLQTKRPSSSLGQKCGMDDPHQLAVDLKGNVMTCQNTGAQGKHNLGHVSAINQVKLNTSTHWSHRESCNHCPVLQLCKGSCMYLHDDLFTQSCENEYHYNTAILAGVLKSVTGLTLQSISGDIRRPPKIKRVIKVIAV